MRSRSARPIAITAAAVLATAASAQTTVFLEPSVFRAGVGEEVELRLVGREAVADEQPAPTAWPIQIEWLFIRFGGVQDNRDRVEPVGEGVNSHVTLTMPAAGVAGCAMLAVDFEPEIVTLTGEQFASLIAARTRVAPDAALRERGQVRVRHVQSAKALIRVGGEAGAVDASTAVSKAGQAVEIRPFADPTLTPAPGDFPARMYIGGDAFGSPRLHAAHVPTGESREVTASSTAILPMTAAGRWRVEFHHAAPLTGDPEADWALYTATLVFEAPAAGPGGGR